MHKTNRLDKVIPILPDEFNITSVLNRALSWKDVHSAYLRDLLILKVEFVPKKESAEPKDS